MARIKFTKHQQKQYDALLKSLYEHRNDYERRNNITPKITRREFLDYYNESRKARRKVQRLQRAGELSGTRGYALSTNVGFIRSRQEFLYRRKKIREQLRPDYRKRVEKREKERAEENILELFGKTDVAIRLIRYIRKMSLKKLNAYLDQNRHLMFIKYESDPEKLRKRLDRLGLTIENIALDLGLKL